MPIETNLDIVNEVGGGLITRIDRRGIGDVNGDLVPFHPFITWPLLVGSLSTFIWTNFFNTSIYRLFAVRVNTTVAGGAAAAVQVVVCPQGVAIGSGVSQLAPAIDLTATAPAKLSGVFGGVPTDIGPGDSLALFLSGTLTGLVGVITLGLRKMR